MRQHLQMSSHWLETQRKRDTAPNENMIAVRVLSLQAGAARRTGALIFIQLSWVALAYFINLDHPKTFLAFYSTRARSQPLS